MSDVISLTPDSVDAVLPDVPKLARLAIRFASNLKRGTLDMTLPDGIMLPLSFTPKALTYREGKP